MKRFAVAAILALGLAGCESPKKTVDQLRQEIGAYQTNPTDAAQAKIEADFTRLDTQIRKLDAKGKTDEAAGYRTNMENLRADYRAARLVRTMKETQSAIQGIGQAFKEAGKSIGDAFRDGNATPTPTPR